MRTLVIILIVFAIPANAQKLVLEYTKMIGGKANEGVNDALFDARDNTIVFVGFTSDSCNTGDLPPCPTVGGSDEVLIGKVDNNRNIVWLKEYGGSRRDRGTSITITVDGGYALLSYSESMDGDVIANHGTVDYWLTKLDAGGNIQWQKCYGSFSSEQPSHIIQTKDKGFILTGESNGSGGDVPFQYVASPFTDDWFVIKVDSQGNKQWAKTLGGTGDEELSRLMEVDNGYYLAGHTRSRDHECSDTSWRANKTTYNDFVLIRLDSAGNYQWNKTYGGSWADRLSDAIFDERDSTIVLIGSTDSYDFMVPPPATGQSAGDIWLVKVNKDGSIKWSKRLGDNSLEDLIRINKPPQGNGYVVSCRALVFPPVPWYYFCTDGGSNTHIFIVDSNGTLQTDKVIGGNKGETRSVALNVGNRICIVGESTANVFGEGISSPHRGIQDIYLSYLYYFPSSVENQNVKQPFEVYPNPVNETLTVEGLEPNTNIQLTDVLGRTVYQTVSPSGGGVGGGVVTIPTKEIPVGNYILHLSNSTNGTTVKVVKE